jgi:Optic atrophy 3 protein (OPA3)
MNMRLLGHNVKRIKALDPKVAVGNGADLLSEGLIFTSAGGALAFEFWRKDRVAALKKTEEAKKVAAIEHVSILWFGILLIVSVRSCIIHLLPCLSRFFVCVSLCVCVCVCVCAVFTNQQCRNKKLA